MLHIPAKVLFGCPSSSPHQKPEGQNISKCNNGSNSCSSSPMFNMTWVLCILKLSTLYPILSINHLAKEEFLPLQTIKYHRFYAMWDQGGGKSIPQYLYSDLISIPQNIESVIFWLSAINFTVMVLSSVDSHWCSA